MRHLKQGSVWILTPAMLVFTLFLISNMAPAASAAGGDEAMPQGQKLFVDQYKCNMCHSVSSAGIEAKAKSEKMRGPDLTGVVAEKGAEWATKFIKREVKLDDNEHKKQWKGSDDDLKTIVDWLATQEKAAS
jgi:cytochrome c2